MNDTRDSQHISFRIRNSLSELEKICGNLEAFGETTGLSKRTLLGLHLILEEICTNIISYGYTDEADHWIDICLRYRHPTLLIRVEDDAMAFNPLVMKRPEVAQDLENQRIGGLGCYLIKKYINFICYERYAGKNILTMSKVVENMNNGCS